MSARTPGVSRTVVRWCTVGVVVAGCAGALLVGVGTMQRASAQSTAVDLVGVAPFAVLTTGTVTSTATDTGAGTSSITGDVGGSTVTGLDHRVTGAVSTGGDTAQALADLGVADDSVASSPVTAALSSVGGTLRPGTYGVSGSIDVPGALTLDAGGNADATFIIKTDAGFTTGDATSITLAGGARACNVFWLSGGSATVEGTVVGTVFGRAGVTVRNGATVTGRLLARSGAVRLDNATVQVPTDCDGAPSTAGTGTTTATTPPATDGAGTGPSSSPAGGSRRSSSPENDTTTSEGDSDRRRAGAGEKEAGAGRAGGTAGDGRTSGRSPDATTDRTAAPSTADSRAGGQRRHGGEPGDEPGDEPGGTVRRDSAGAPVVTVPGLDPDDAEDGAEPGVGRRVLGVLGQTFPRQT